MRKSEKSQTRSKGARRYKNLGHSISGLFVSFSTSSSSTSSLVVSSHLPRLETFETSNSGLLVPFSFSTSSIFSSFFVLPSRRPRSHLVDTIFVDFFFLMSSIASSSSLSLSSSYNDSDGDEFVDFFLAGGDFLFHSLYPILCLYFDGVGFSAFRLGRLGLS